jgi:hypothetical protein
VPRTTTASAVARGDTVTSSTSMPTVSIPSATTLTSGLTTSLNTESTALFVLRIRSEELRFRWKT